MEIDGRRFASQAEGKRYLHLKAEAAAGRITALRCQVRFVLRVEGERVGAYWADFQYVRDGRLVVEDVKGMKTPVYLLKKRMVKAQYKVEVTEVR